MLSSEIGLEVVPHVMAPAGIDELARGAAVRELPDVAAWPILFVPGVRTPASEGIDGWADADVMRGEECETLGALSVRSIRGPAAFVWPGSHTKLVEVDAEGRIVRSHTTLAGEMTAALARHTLIAASLPESLPEKPDPDAVAAGARLAQRDGIGRAAFLVRVAALEGAMPSEQRAAFWVGAVAADDAMRLARHTILRRQVPVFVGGREPQRALYAAMLEERLARPVTPLDDEEAESASAIGALEVARRRGERRAPRRDVLNPG
jgi:2-dehydro-3-deoxygalactonokinase